MATRQLEARTAMSLSPWRFVVTFGVVSLLVDIVYEGARSISGPFLGSLGASAVLIGGVTAAGEAAALVLRLISGPAADRSHRYWGWAIGGYAITVVSVPALALPVGLAGACVLIIAERVGKAVRSPAKDALLAHAGTNVGRGKAFAVHEALDQTGAFAGPLLVAAALAVSGGYQLGFGLLLIPGVIALAILVGLARRVPEPSHYEASHTAEDGSPLALPRSFWRYAGFTALTMAGFATFGLVGYHLASRDIVAESVVPLIYAAAMGVDALAALATGHLFDRHGLKVLTILPLLAGLGTCLAFTGNPATAISGALLWGAALGVQESTLRAGVAGLVPSGRRASAYGVFAAAYGVAWLAGGTLLGFLYEQSLTALVVMCVAVQLSALLMLALTGEGRRPQSA
jgi:MFS family permease